MIRAEVFVFGSSPELLEGRRLSFVSKSSEPVVYCKKLEKLCVGSCSDHVSFIEIPYARIPENSQGGLDLEMTQYEL